MSQQVIEHQGTVSSAADMMPDIDALEIANGDREDNRDDLGRFKAAQEEAGTDVEAEDAEQEAKADDEAPQKETEVEEGEEDWFEIAAEEEGAEPKRLKASEVFEGYQRAQQLETEIENLKSTAPPPPDYDRATLEAVERGTQYLTGLQQLEDMLQPFQPDENLINPNSEHYDPDTYFAQQQHAKSQSEQLARVQAERERVQQEVTQQQEAVQRARYAREQSKLLESWPELKEEATQNKVREDASRHYGIDQETLNSVHDARFYAVLKDALAYREQTAAKETAVKVVKAKPKLVKGKARTNNNGRSAEGMRRLSQSGAIEDAVDALDGLL